MSIDRCSRCGDLVDTDGDCEAYIDISNQRHGPENWQCFCQRCRERREDELGEPSDLEMLEIDAERAVRRYQEALEKAKEKVPG